MEVKRGTSNNVSIRWNETTDKWQLTNDGTTYYDILTQVNTDVALGVETTGNYVASLVAGSGVTLTNGAAAEGGTPTVAVTANTFEAYGAVATHEADTTAVHGIADTSLLVTTTGSQTLTNKTITAPTGLVKGDVGLTNVDDTTDANKPVSTAGQTALDLKANIASPTFTGTVSGVTKAMVGLTNVDDTTDASKPVSTAGQTALDLKANLASPTFTGTVAVPVLIVDSIEVDTTGAISGQVLKYNGIKFIPASDEVAAAGSLGSIDGHTDVTITTPTVGQVLKWNGSVWINDLDDIGIVTDVALGVDTTGDYVASLVAGTGITLTNNSGESATPTVAVTANTFDAYGAAANAATNAATALTNHEADTTNIHGIADTSILVTTTGTQTLTNKIITSPVGIVKGDVGLGNVDNTSDANKPVSTAGQTALDLKANLASPTFTGNVNMSVLYVDGIEIDPTGASNTQVLKYNSSTNKFVPGVASIVANIVDLTDVQITSPANNQVLKYSSVSNTWINATSPGGSGSGGLTYSSNIGDNVSSTYLIVHNLGTRDVVVVTRNNDSPHEVISVRWEATTENTVTLDFSAPITSNSVRASVFAAVTGDGYEPVPGPAMVSLNDAGDVIITSASLDSGQFLKWNGSAWVNDAIDLSTDTVGSFVQSLVAGTGITLSNNSGENATPTITVDTTAIQAVVANVSNTEIGYLDGVTSAIQTQIDTKAPLASPTFTGTVSGITKTMVGLTNVDDTSDASKPVSTAGQTALDLKANIASPTFTGTVTLPSNTVTSAMIADATIVNDDISTTAGIDLGKLADATIVEEIGSRTLLLTDKNRFIKMTSGSPNTVTVPTDASVNFPIGSQIHIIQYGSGKTQILPVAGTPSIYGTPGQFLRAQYSSATLLKCDTNIWMLMGDLSAS